MSTPTFINLIGANPSASVLSNLQTAPAAAQAEISSKLNANLKERLAGLLAATPVLAGLVGMMPEIDLAAASGLSIEVLIKQQLDPMVSKDPVMQKAVDEEIAKTGNTQTVSTFLGLGLPLQSHPLFQAVEKANPTAVFAQSISKQPVINIGLVQTILTDNPSLKPGMPLPAVVNMGSLSQADQVTVRASWDALSKEIKTYPGFDYAAALEAGGGVVPPSAFVNPIRSGVIIFLANSPGFDFQTTTIKAYINSHPAALRNIQQVEQAAVIAQLTAYQRMYRVYSDAPTINNLMAAGLSSARDISSIPAGVFVKLYSGLLGGKVQAETIYSKAQFIVAQISQIYLRFKEALGRVNPKFNGSYSNATGNLLQQFPDWQKLFGPTGYCECDECMAVDGPTAYFVDLLQYLGNVMPNVSTDVSPNSYGYTPLDVLIGYENNPNNFNYSNTPASLIPAPDSNPPAGRRPDLAYLKLNCENTETIMPYIDLVNEILESYIYYVGMGITITGVKQFSALELKLPTPAGNNIPQAGSIVKTNNAVWTTPVGYIMGPDKVTLNLLSPIGDILSLPTGFSMEVKGLPSASNNTPTDATSDELSVNPEYTIQQVYDPVTGPLATAVFPFTLPYNRPLETARLYLKNLNTTLDELMKTFRVNGNPTDLDIRREYIGLSPAELAILDGPHQTDLWEYYGFPTSAAQGNLTETVGLYLGVVQNFMNATGLAFPDLVNLLTTRFINPSQSISIYSPASESQVVTCDMTVSIFQNLDSYSVSLVVSAIGGIKSPSLEYLEVKLGFLWKALIFLRLWKKTGWAMADLDKALFALQYTGIFNPTIAAFIDTDIQHGTDNVIQELAQIKWLLGVLQVSVSQILSLWSNIDSDGRDSLYISLFQNKAVINPMDPNFRLTYIAPAPFVAPLTAWSDGTTAGLPTYNPGHTQLLFTGTMIDAQLDDLLNWATTNALLITAVQNLFDQRWYLGTEVADSALPISSNINTILAALQISEEDLAAIAVDAGLASAADAVITLTATVGPAATWTPTFTPVETGLAATETVTVAIVASVTTLTIGGTITPGDTVNLTAASGSFVTQTVTYLVVTGDSPASIATNLAAQIIGNTVIQAAGIQVTVSLVSWLTTSNLSLGNLSILYRYAMLANALSLSVEDLIALKNISGINPFPTPGNGIVTDAIVEFVKAAQMVAASKFSIDQLNYLYRAMPDLPDSLPPQLTGEQQLLITLSTGLQKIAAADAFAPDPTGKALRKNLGVLLPSDQVDPTMGLIEGSTVYTKTLSALPTDLVSQQNQNPFLLTLVTIEGPLTEKDSIELTFTSNAIQGSKVTVPYPVVSGDTPSSIANALAGKFSGIPALSQAQITAVANGPAITIQTPLVLNPFQAWTALTEPANSSTAVTETMIINGSAASCEVVIGGASFTPGDILTLILAANSSTGAPVSVSYTVLAGDSAGSVASQLASLINGQLALIAAGFTAKSNGPNLAIATALGPGPFQAWTAVAIPAAGATANATETVTVVDAALDQVSYLTSIPIAGAATPGDLVTLALTLGSAGTAAVSLSYPVETGDSLVSVATGLGAAINTNSSLSIAGISATSSGEVLQISSPLFQYPFYTVTTNTVAAPPQATETLNWASPTLTVGGTVITPGDSLTLNMTLNDVPGFSVSIPYKVVSGDTLSSIATNLGKLISGNTTLQAVGISVSDVGAATVTLTAPASLQVTTPTAPAPPAATETVTIASTSSGSTVTIGGSVFTPGDIITLAFSLNGVTGSAVSLSYSVAQGDGVGSIAEGLGQKITGSGILIALGFTASTSPGSGIITITAPSPLALTYSTTPAPAVATETLTVGGVSPVNTVIIGYSSITAGDSLGVSIQLGGGSDSLVSLSYPVAIGDLPASIAGALIGQINSHPTLNATGIIASILPTSSASTTATIALTAAPGLSPMQTWNLSSVVAATNLPGTEAGAAAVSALSCAGPMSDATLANLNLISQNADDTAFNTAVKDLYAQAQNLLSANFTFLAPTTNYISKLASLPAGLLLPTTPPTQVVYNSNSMALACTGPLSYQNKIQLGSLSPDPAFNSALNDLYNQAWGSVIQQLIDRSSLSTPVDRYNYVLQVLLDNLQVTQSKSLVKQTLSQALGMDAMTTDLLLEGDPTDDTPALLSSQSLSTQPAMLDFLGGLLAFYYADSAFTSPPTVQIDPGVDLDGTETPFGGAEWYAQIVPPSTDTYTFNVTLPSAAGSVQLYVNGQDAVKYPQVALQAGQIYPIVMVVTAATTMPIQPQFQLQWSNSSISLQAMPATVFVLGAASNSNNFPVPYPFVQGGAYNTLSLLNRAALLVNGFSMKAAEVEYLVNNQADFVGTAPNGGGPSAYFNFNSLPIDNSSVPQATLDEAAPAFFNLWQRLFRLYKLKAGLQSGGNVGLFDIFQAAVTSNNSTALTIGNTILQATGWSVKEFYILIGKQTAAAPYSTTIGLNLTDVSFRNEQSLVRLADCLALVGEIGVSSQQLFLWALNPPDGSIAQNIANSVKAKYTDTAWIQVGESLNDKIRNRSRDALIAYILANAVTWGMVIDGEPVATADQLYEYFLIDVKMGTCMDTSRLVQATAAVQLFVQRCLMNLENNNLDNPEMNVAPTQLDAGEWVWMQNYRVWQANREVFLFPENWIDPTIRDDRTPFFEDLQNNLLQGPITNDNAEQAYYTYLQALDEVAQLQIMGLCTETDGNSIAPVTVTHVFGRTYGTPYVYYYRNLTQTPDTVSNSSINLWSAWERIDVDIQTDQLIPVFWNNRLYLYWPVYTETANQTANQSQGVTQGPPPPTTYNLQVQMAWSEYRQGAWTKKQITNELFVPYNFSAYQYAAIPSTTPAVTETVDILNYNEAPSGDGAGYTFIMITIGGWVTAGDVLTLTFSVNSEIIFPWSYTVVATDSPLSIATNLNTAVNTGFEKTYNSTSDPIKSTLDLYGGSSITIQNSGGYNLLSVQFSSTAATPLNTIGGVTTDPGIFFFDPGSSYESATEIIITSPPADDSSSIVISGFPTPGDIVTLTFIIYGISTPFSYQVGASDSLIDIAAGLSNLINSSTNIAFQSQKIKANSYSNTITLNTYEIIQGTGVSPCPANPPTQVLPGFMQSFFFSTTFDEYGDLVIGMLCYHALFEIHGTVTTLNSDVSALSYAGIGQFTFTGYSNSSEGLFYSQPWPFASQNASFLQPVNMQFTGFGGFIIDSNIQSINTIIWGLLNGDDSAYYVVFPQENFIDIFSGESVEFAISLPFIFSDSQRTYFVAPANLDYNILNTNPSLQFYTLFHPHLRDFLQTLNDVEIPGLLQLQTQELADMYGQHFYTSADPGLTPPAGYHNDGIVCYLFTVAPVSNGIPLSLQGSSGSSTTYFIYSTAQVGTVPLYFLTNDALTDGGLNNGQYFYTISEIERQNAMNWYNYSDDGILGYVYDPASNMAGTNSSGPIYRLSSPDFVQVYGPDESYVVSPFPMSDVDFMLGGAYSIYNWELFFHIPLLIATQLSQNQQFADAQTWFHYIFNPTNDAAGNAPNSYWNFLPFNQNSEVETLLDMLEDLNNPSSPNYANMMNQVAQYEINPFDPDAIARLRPVAYQKTVVMKYIDNLIAWGDYLFGQNTRESINEATQLYVLAQQILGPQPVMVSSEVYIQPTNFMGLGQLDELSDVIVQAESLFPFSSGPGGGNFGSNGGDFNPNRLAYCFYFCIPPNVQLLAYWSTVADRLYKIRHCMNIQGQVQQLALFAPPINPALLVAATAAGVDLSSVLGDINAALPYYRFSYLFPKAVELCSEVRSLGGELLSALEKNDAEALSMLRANQELAVLNAVLLIKQSQVQEAAANVQAMQASLAVVTYRQAYYNGLINTGLNSFETGQVTALTAAQAFKTAGQVAQLSASIAALFPNFSAGGAGISSPLIAVTYGGSNISGAGTAAAQAYSLFGDIYSYLATMASLLGQWDRRNQEWGFQLQSANLEWNQINQQVNAAQFRATIAQQDLDSQNLQIGNASDVLSFLQAKFTNEDLYSWMVNQVSAVYFQCYQLAYSLAKQAEACFRFEMGIASSTPYIQFGYWDNLKRGLLSGEKLYLDLKRLEQAYMDQNKREYEITRNISLLLLDPIALITLKQSGQCIVVLPEAFFDMDYPGHYMRRIKTLSMTIPCVTGPYTSVNCTLTLVQNKVRWDSSVGGSYAEQPVASDSRFFYNFAASQAIATSTAQNDSGLFEVNFRDERYLPFEGAGVLSQWLISMPQDCNAFDFDTITDVIFNLRYTARDGGAQLSNAARNAARMPAPVIQSALSSQQTPFPAKQTNLMRFFSLKHEFPSEWYQFMHPNGLSIQTMAFFLQGERFPFQYRGKKITISQVQLLLIFKAVYPPFLASTSTPLDDYASGQPLQVILTPPSSYPPAATTVVNPNGKLVSNQALFNSVPYAQIPFQSAPSSLVSAGQPKPWTLAIQGSGIQGLSANLQVQPVSGGGPFLNPEVIDDIFFVCQYSVG